MGPQIKAFGIDRAESLGAFLRPLVRLRDGLPFFRFS